MHYLSDPAVIKMMHHTIGIHFIEVIQKFQMQNNDTEKTKIIIIIINIGSNKQNKKN